MSGQPESAPNCTFITIHYGARTVLAVYAYFSPCVSIFSGRPVNMSGIPCRLLVEARLYGHLKLSSGGSSVLLVCRRRLANSNKHGGVRTPR